MYRSYSIHEPSGLSYYLWFCAARLQSNANLECASYQNHRAQMLLNATYVASDIISDGYIGRIQYYLSPMILVACIYQIRWISKIFIPLHSRVGGNGFKHFLLKQAIKWSRIFDRSKVIPIRSSPNAAW